MPIVRGKSPSITKIFPRKAPEQQQKNIWISGEGFTGTSTVTINGIGAASTTLLSDGRLQCLLAAGISANPDSEVVVTQGVYNSIPFPFPITPGTPIASDYNNKPEDQRQLVLPASFRSRGDQQRIPAGQNFSGTTPVFEQGTIGAATPLLQTGGRWCFNHDVLIRNIEFYSRNGAGLITAESTARGAGSGIFLCRIDGSETLLVDLANTTASVVVTDNLLMTKRDYIKIVTAGATLEMVATVNSVIYTRSISF